jgi:hypothetical protein
VLVVVVTPCPSDEAPIPDFELDNWPTCPTVELPDGIVDISFIEVTNCPVVRTPAFPVFGRTVCV